MRVFECRWIGRLLLLAGVLMLAAPAGGIAAETRTGPAPILCTNGSGVNGLQNRPLNGEIPY